MELNSREFGILQSEAQLCVLSLIPAKALIIRDSWRGHPKLSDDQRAWYVGFIGGWGVRVVERERFSQDRIPMFVNAVFTMLFEPIGEKEYLKAVGLVQVDGGHSRIAEAAQKEFISWDGGQFVPMPPSR